MLKTFAGHCHCGAIRFEADIDFERGTWKCNCSICAMHRFWMAEGLVGSVRLLEGGDLLTDYTFKDGVAHHYFCRRCGIHPYEWISLPKESREYYNINILCLDNLDLDEVLAVPVVYVDGLHDRWDRAPAEIRHL